METLLRYFLSFFMGLILISCSKNHDDLSVAQRRELSKEMYQEEVSKHGFDGPFQGTPIGMTLLDDILALDSTNCEALRAYSVPYLKRGIPHKWKRWFDKAVECDPKMWQPWRGYLYLWFYRDYKRAIDDFNASDTLTPNFIDSPQGHSVDYWRGIAYLGLKDYTNSIRYFDTHIATVTKDSGEDWVEPSAFLYLGIVHFENSNLEKANLNIDKALQYYQNVSADSHYYKALLQARNKAHAEALISVNKAIENYNQGYYSKRDYVEEIRQIYPQQLESLRNAISDSISRNK
ncbi:tetratricopeptide repeat protein [Aquimarina sp. 2304DJ70-9]|uniref:tetratricopeptide repeat protein n=1 Tax=Aquimarina penaris TaxID=3231044 RepID=UPI0034629F38